MAFDWRKIFGLGSGHQGPQQPSAQQARPFKAPWGPEDEMMANLAIGNLREMLLTLLNEKRRGVHTEALMVVVGAFAGHAAAQAAHLLKGKPGNTMLLSVKTDDGAVYYFGDGLNRFLAPEDPAIPSLWGLIAPAAIEAGVPAEELPNPGPIFGFVTQSIGRSEFGKIRAPEGHPPHWPPRECLDTFWPFAREVLASTRAPGADRASLPIQHWPVVVALVARQFIGMTKATLDPRLSLQFLMESAIAMSKVDPAIIPQERAMPKP